VKPAHRRELAKKVKKVTGEVIPAADYLKYDKPSSS